MGDVTHSYWGCVPSGEMARQARAVAVCAFDAVAAAASNNP